MANDQSLFHVDSITVDGKPLAIEDGTAMVDGVAGYANAIVASASGPDYTKRQRVPRTLTMKVQFGPSVNPDDLKNIRNAQVVLRDLEAPRRCMAPNCSFASMGAVGGGTVDLTLNVLEPYIWL